MRLKRLVLDENEPMVLRATHSFLAHDTLKETIPSARELSPVPESRVPHVIPTMTEEFTTPSTKEWISTPTQTTEPPTTTIIEVESSSSPIQTMTTIEELLEDECPPPPRKRLRQKRPPLPEPPERHPVYGWKNYYDPNYKWDPEKEYEFIGIVDCVGHPPFRAYLVHWTNKPVELSYVWADALLPNYADLINQVDQWFTAKSGMSFERYANRHFRRAGESAEGTCFIQAMQAIGCELGNQDLISFGDYADFMRRNNLKMEDGVSKSEVILYFEFLRRQHVPLDYDVLFVKQQKGSLSSASKLQIFAQSLVPGLYLVMAACVRTTRHCFGMIVSEDKKVEVIDGFCLDDSPAYIKEDILVLDWIVGVQLIRRVALAG